MVAVEGLGTQERSGAGSGELKVGDVREDAFEFQAGVVGGETDFVLVAATKGEQGEALEGGIEELLAELDFLVVEALEIMATGVLDGGMEGGEGLDEDFAFDIAAAGAASDLGEELKGAFAGAEVGEVQAEVGMDDADEGDVGEVEAFGDHLGADEDVDAAEAEVGEDTAEVVLALEGIGVHAGDAGIGCWWGCGFFGGFGCRGG